MSKLNDWIDEVSESPLKALVWLVVIAAICFVCYKLYNTLYDMIKEKAKTSDYDVKKDDLTYPNSWYTEAAESLYAAMDGVGTDEDRIMSIITQLKTQNDWNAVVSAFGYRKLYWTFYPVFEGTLPQCLVNELSSSYIDRIRQHLTSLGVTVGF